MSFPATEFFEKVYRNSLKSISRHIKEKNNEYYHVYNLSEREYGEENAFEGKVTYLKWHDHHSPTFSLLFETCVQMH